MAVIAKKKKSPDGSIK